MDPVARRELLSCQPNPHPGEDFLTEISAQIPAQESGPPYSLCVRYVPDRLILADTDLSPYLETISKVAWGSLEQLAAAILGDIQNEAVPRWVRVRIERPAADGPVLLSQSTELEGRQPGWENKWLLRP